MARKSTINQSKEETEVIDEEDSEDWKLEVMHGVNAGVHASVSLGLVFFQSKARVWVDCSVPAAWKTAMIALQSKARSWVDCSVPAAWKTTKIASPCEARGWVVCAVHCAWCSQCSCLYTFGLPFANGNDHTSMTAPLPVCSAKLSMLGLS